MVTGRKGDYRPEVVTKIIDAIRDGATDKAASAAGGIHRDTFYTWLKEKPDFADKVKTARQELEESVILRTTASLYQRAWGYSYKEVETFTAKDAEGNIKETTRKEKEKRVVPDVAAQVFILCNREPERWRNVQRVEAKVQQDQPENTISFADVPDELLNQLAECLFKADKGRNKEEKGGR